MARRRVSRNLPMEWKADTINTTSATVTTGEFDLDLLPDEIAEIIGIDSDITWANLPDAANDDLEARKYLSMDPDASATPLTDTTLEDLEIFFSHVFHIQQEVGAAGTAFGKNSENKQMWFPEGKGILVGTNFSQVVVADDTIACDFHTRVYFKRRKASASELNQILLKRR